MTSFERACVHVPSGPSPQTRKPKSIFVDILGMFHEFQILNACEYNSTTRKCTPTIVHTLDGHIKLYHMDTDTDIFECLGTVQLYREKSVVHLGMSSTASNGMSTGR